MESKESDTTEHAHKNFESQLLNMYSLTSKEVQVKQCLMSFGTQIIMEGQLIFVPFNVYSLGYRIGEKMSQASLYTFPPYPGVFGK